MGREQFGYGWKEGEGGDVMVLVGVGAVLLKPASRPFHLMTAPARTKGNLTGKRDNIGDSFIFWKYFFKGNGYF